MLTSISTSFYDFFRRAQGDLIYGFLLLLSLLIAILLRQDTTFILRRRFDGLIGLTITYLSVGNCMHFCSLLLVGAHLFLYQFVKNPSHLTQCSFFGSFLYLALLRTMHFVGLPKLEFVTNAIQLIITLRAIGLSYEIADWRAKKDGNQQDGSAETGHCETIDEPPTTLDAFNYLYSFTGLFTGPYYTYRTYWDSLTRWKKPLDWTKLWPMLAVKIRTLGWSLPALIFMTWLDPVNALRGDQLDQQLGSILWLFLRCALAFVYLRMRIYSAWMVAESICLVAGIGIYPREAAAEPGKGPTDGIKLHMVKWDNPSVEFDAETISNLDIPSVEHSDGFRSGMRAWNRTVQFWLANFVYRRSSRAIRMPYTMLVSAFWHGVHPGYFLSFLTVPLCTAAEDALFRAFPAEHRPKWIQIGWSFIRTRGFEFMASGFLLLDGWDTLRLWSRMFFWLHFTMFAIIAWVYIEEKRRDKKTNSEAKFEEINTHLHNQKTE